MQAFDREKPKKRRFNAVKNYIGWLTTVSSYQVIPDFASQDYKALYGYLKNSRQLSALNTTMHDSATTQPVIGEFGLTPKYETKSMDMITYEKLGLQHRIKIALKKESDDQNSQLLDLVQTQKLRDAFEDDSLTFWEQTFSQDVIDRFFSVAIDKAVTNPDNFNPAKIFRRLFANYHPNSAIGNEVEQVKLTEIVKDVSFLWDCFEKSLLYVSLDSGVFGVSISEINLHG